MISRIHGFHNAGFGRNPTALLSVNFIAMIQNALANLTENLNNHNLSERNRFFRSR